MNRRKMMLPCGLAMALIAVGIGYAASEPLAPTAGLPERLASVRQGARDLQGRIEAAGDEDRWHMLASASPERKCGKLSFELHAVILAKADRLAGLTAEGKAVLEFDSLKAAKAARGKKDDCATIGDRVWLAKD